MNRERVSLFLAIAAGIILGGVTGSQFDAPIGLILGALIGGGSAWALVEPVRLWRGLTLAVHHAYTQTKNRPPIDWAWNRRCLRHMMIVWSCSASCAHGILCLLLLFMYFFVLPKKEDDFWIMFGGSLYLSVIIGGLFALIAFITPNPAKDRTDRIWEMEDVEKTCKKYALHGNVISLLVTHCLLIPFSILGAIINHIPSTARFLWRAAQLTFLYVNNERRVAALTFGAIGSVIGIATGHILLAAVIGAVLGTAQHALTTNLRSRLADRLATNT